MGSFKAHDANACKLNPLLSPLGISTPLCTFAEFSPQDVLSINFSQGLVPRGPILATDINNYNYICIMSICMTMIGFHFFIVFATLKNWSAWSPTALLHLKLQCANKIAGWGLSENLEKKNSMNITHALIWEEFGLKLFKFNSPMWMIRTISSLLSSLKEL